VTRKERYIQRSNPFVYHCAECNMEILVETYEEMAYAIRIKGLCEDCSEKEDEVL